MAPNGQGRGRKAGTAVAERGSSKNRLPIQKTDLLSVGRQTNNRAHVCGESHTLAAVRWVLRRTHADMHGWTRQDGARTSSLAHHLPSVVEDVRKQSEADTWNLPQADCRTPQICCSRGANDLVAVVEAGGNAAGIRMLGQKADINYACRCPEEATRCAATVCWSGIAGNVAGAVDE